MPELTDWMQQVSTLIPPELLRPPVPEFELCGTCGAALRFGYACTRCVNCDDCGARVMYVNTFVTANGHDVCRACLRANYWRCERCDEWTHNSYGDCHNDCSDDPYDDDDDQDDDDEGGCTCEACRQARREARRASGGSSERGYVHGYSYKPPPDFHGDGPLYLGMELETETRSGRYDRCSALACRHLGSVGYLKSDSSLHSGFEMVTHPMSYKYAMENFPWDMLGELEQAGAWTESSRTGLHVHVSRDAFASPLHVYKWMKFVYRNQRQVIQLARRESDEWAPFDPDTRRDIKHIAKGGRSMGRYQAINPQNDETFELRMFASSLKPEEVKAALGFAAASVEYTRTLTVADITKAGGWTWGAFNQWLSTRPDYQPLAKHLEDLQCVS